MWEAIYANLASTPVRYHRIERVDRELLRIWTGVPGIAGLERIVPMPVDQAIEIFRRETALTEADGFTRAAISWLFVRCSTVNNVPTQSEIDVRARCIKALKLALEPTGLGMFDGVESGSGSWGITFQNIVETEIAAVRAKEAVSAIAPTCDVSCLEHEAEIDDDYPLVPRREITDEPL